VRAHSEQPGQTRRRGPLEHHTVRADGLAVDHLGLELLQDVVRHCLSARAQVADDVDRRAGRIPVGRIQGRQLPDVAHACLRRSGLEQAKFGLEGLLQAVAQPLLAGLDELLRPLRLRLDALSRAAALGEQRGRDLHRHWSDEDVALRRHRHLELKDVLGRPLAKRALHPRQRDIFQPRLEQDGNDALERALGDFAPVWKDLRAGAERLGEPVRLGPLLGRLARGEDVKERDASVLAEGSGHEPVVRSG